MYIARPLPPRNTREGEAIKIVGKVIHLQVSTQSKDPAPSPEIYALASKIFRGLQLTQSWIKGPFRNIYIQVGVLRAVAASAALPQQKSGRAEEKRIGRQVFSSFSGK